LYENLYGLRLVISGILFDSQDGFFLVFLIEELQGERNDFGIVLGLALVLILLGFEPSFKVDQASLLEVFISDLSKPTLGFDVEKISPIQALGIILAFVAIVLFTI